jgi:hypothetical protein
MLQFLQFSKAQEKSIQTQLIVNKININKDIIDIVKSFIFYEKKYYQQIYKQKLYKSIINNKFKNELIRNINNTYKGHWEFSSISKNEDLWLQFQAINCIICGNYILPKLTIHDNKYLHCIDNSHQINYITI